MEDPDLKEDLLRTIEYGLRDNVKARVVDGTGDNGIRRNPEEPAPFRSQEKLYEYYKNLNRQENES